MVATANYYRDQLGFHYERFWNEPPSFCMVKRNGIVIMLAQLEAPGAIRPNRMVDPEGSAWDAYIWIDNADALYAEFKSKGVTFLAEDIESPVCRMAIISDPDGNAIVLHKLKSAEEQQG